MKYIVLGLFCSLFSSAVAQLPLFIDDQFSEPSTQWYWSDVNDENNYRKVKDGELYQEQKGPNIFWTLRSANINPTKDFKIETKFRAVEAMTNGMLYIIIDGAQDFYLYFGINTEKKTYWIGTEQKGNWQTLNVTSDSKPEPTADAILTGLQDNILAIEVISDRISFKVNGTAVESLNYTEKFPLIRSSISYIGIATSAPMKTAVDYYQVYQDRKINLLTTEKLNIKKTRLSSAINTKSTEKWPVISPDGKTLFFVRKSGEMNTDGKESDNIWFSKATSDTSWAQAEVFPRPLNNNAPNTVMSVTPDNNTLFLMHQYKPDDGEFKSSGFSVSTRTVDGWSMPKDIVMTNYYNDGEYNEFYLSSDRKVMLLTIKRKDTYGQNDLYVSMLQENGTYSEPKNMGPVLNTYATEMSPFLAADERTLYFGSDGHPGYGSSDIFVSKRLDDTWLNWSVPQNLGPEINSPSWEAYFAVPASGAYAYIAINPTDNLDLFRVDLPKLFRPDPVIIVSGKVIDTKTKQPVGASIVYSDIMKSEAPGNAVSNPGDGTYKIALPSGKNYAFLAQKDGYYAVSENLDLTNLKTYGEVTKDLYVTPIEAGQTIRLNNIFFDFNKSDLKSESFQELDRVIELLKNNAGLVIEVGGHTDNAGEDAYNLKLSQSRSDAVARYITGKGISTSKVTAKGYGETKPVTANTTDVGRATNRRVEFTILKK